MYDNVKFLRLKNGDDIVSEVVELDDGNTNSYHLINPFKVVYVESSRSGYIQVAFMPWVFSKICDKQEFTIEQSEVLMVAVVSDYMHEYYWNSIESIETHKKETETVENREPSEEELEAIKELMETITDKRTLH